jgi:hypothetical protein
MAAPPAAPKNAVSSVVRPAAKGRTNRTDHAPGSTAAVRAMSPTRSRAAATDQASPAGRLPSVTRVAGVPLARARPAGSWNRNGWCS